MYAICKGKIFNDSYSELCSKKSDEELTSFNNCISTNTYSLHQEIDVTSPFYLIEKNNCQYIIQPPNQSIDNESLSQIQRYQNTVKYSSAARPKIKTSSYNLTDSHNKRMHNNESRILPGYHISSLDDRHKDVTRYRSTPHNHPLVNQNSTTQKVEYRSHRNNIPRQYERKLVSNNTSHREKLLEADKVKVPSKNIQLPSTSASKSVKDYSRVHSHSKPKPDIVSQSNYLKHLERTKPELANISPCLTNGNSSSHSLEKEIVQHIKSVEPFSCLQDPNAVVPQKITYPKKINLKEYKERKNNANNAGIQRSQEANIKSSSPEVQQSVSNRSKEISKNSSSVSRILEESLDPLLWAEAKSIIPSASNGSVKTISEPMNSISSSSKEFNNTETARPEDSLQKGVNRYNIEKEAFYSTSKIAKNDAHVEKNFLDDPVILTISSDEEDNKDDSEDYRDDCGKEKAVVSELCHHSVSEAQKNSMLAGGGSHEDFVSLNCKTIRLGSYKADLKYPKEFLKLEKDSLTMVVPSLIKDKDPVTLILKQRGIYKIRVQLEGDEPMMFIYIMPNMAAYIREKLHMKKGGPYLGPESEDEVGIGIFLYPVKPESKHSILEFCSNGTQKSSQSPVFFKEISVQEANEVLISMTKSNEEQDSNQICTRQETKTLFVYPPPPKKGGITITTDDYYCLEEEQFLNDVIIDFYIKWFMLSQLAEKDRERAHVFSTFFYKCLTSKPKTVQRHSPEVEQKLTAAQMRHARVQSWTKNVDIFEKDFIIVPINQRSHWFLAVICFPGLDGPVRIKDGKPVSIKRIENSRSRVKAMTKVESSLMEDTTEWSDRDEAEADEEELEEDKIEPPPTKKLKFEKDNDQGATTTTSLQTDEEDPIKQPWILIFDSMSGSSKKRIVATLREYLAQEYIMKKGKFKNFSTETIKGTCPKVPQQNNFTDCGLFTLQFVQSFFEHPLKDFRDPIKSMANWFNQDIVGCKRRYIADIIKQLLNDQKPHHGISLPSLHFTSNDKTQPTNKYSIEKMDSKSSVEKLGNYSSIETILKTENLCLNREHKMEDDEPCRKSWPSDLNSTTSSSCSSTIDYQPQAGSEVIQKEAKKIQVKPCDKSLSSARPRTPLPYNETSNLPLANSEDEDSGNHSDEISKDILNKGFLETSSGSRENLCSKYENSKASFEKNENFSGNSNSSSICIRKQNFSGSSNSASKKNSKEESSKRTSKKSLKHESLSMSSNSAFRKIGYSLQSNNKYPFHSKSIHDRR